MTCQIPTTVLLSPLIIPILLLYIPACALKIYTLDAWNVRPPRARKRKRRLSLPFDSKIRPNEVGHRAWLRETIKKPMTEQQSGFGFFALPIEIREMIYKEYVGDEKVWIKLSRTSGLCGFRGLDMDRVGVDMMPLLLACRRTYSELVRYLYTQPNFIFLDPVSFCVFSAGILPTRFNSIRNLHIDLDTCAPNHPVHSEYYRLPNKLLRKSYKIVRRASSRFHNALPSEGVRLERDRTLWQKILDILAVMKGLRNLEVSANMEIFEYSHYSMMHSDMVRPSRTTPLRELLLFGMKRDAKIKFQIREKNGEVMECQELSEGVWKTGLEEGQDYRSREKWHEKMTKLKMSEFKVAMQLDQK